MTTITINEKPYELETLSDNAKAQLQMLQITEQEIVRLNAQLAITQTARQAYANALNGELVQMAA